MTFGLGRPAFANISPLSVDFDPFELRPEYNV
jgi:hypothetical protein